jgi:hypothetical protein
MWIFSVLGFYSIACGRKGDGSLDPDTVMVRARRKQHLENIRKRFPAVSKSKIICTSNCDYRYRIVIPKSTWIGILSELAEEQTWSNFKDEVSRRQPPGDSAYVRALHDVWWTMLNLQTDPKPPKPRNLTNLSSGGPQIRARKGSKRRKVDFLRNPGKNGPAGAQTDPATGAAKL